MNSLLSLIPSNQVLHSVEIGSLFSNELHSINKNLSKDSVVILVPEMAVPGQQEFPWLSKGA